jgi:hypothetical protein
MATPMVSNKAIRTPIESFVAHKTLKKEFCPFGTMSERFSLIGLSFKT